MSAARHPTWLIAQVGNNPERLQAYVDCGVQVIEVPAAKGESLICRAPSLSWAGVD